MPKFDIWSQGFQDQGMEGVPQAAFKLNESGPIEAGCFDEAVRTHIDSLSIAPEYLGGPTPASYYRQDDDGTWRMWGLQLSPDEATARNTCFG